MRKLGHWLLLLATLLATLAATEAPIRAKAPAATPVKGLILDAARQVYTVPTLKTYIRRVQAGGGTFLQLHLTDNERFGVENAHLGQTVKLAQRKHGVYYNRRTGKAFLSKRQLRELVVYGHRRQVEVIPEIDTPGHSRALITLMKHATPRTRKLVKVITNQTDELDITQPQTAPFVQKLLGEYTGLLYQNQHLGIGGDEYSSEAASTQPNVVAYTNALNRYLNRRHLQATLWNDQLMRADLPKIDHNILILYWSYDGQTADTQVAVQRRSLRASLPELNQAGFQTINANFSYLYVIASPKMFRPASVTFWQNDLATHWTPRIWDNWNHATPATSVANVGSALSIWGDGHHHYSQKTLLKRTKPFLTTYFAQ